MKKKTIEKIPYLGLKKISRIKSVKYIGVTAVKNIGHQRHLFLEVYENKKESKKIPVVRITLTKKDFGTYWPDKHVWTRQQVSAYRPIWMETHTGGILADENILQSPEDLARIKSFCGTRIYNDTRWWEHIAEYEGNITSKERTNRVERKYKRRQEALKDRQANTKALPEKAILYRADHVYFHDEHFLYYKKHGSWADIACSKCGGVTTARWKSSGAYEDQFEKHIAEPREGDFGTCPMCGAHGQYKCKGKVKGSIRKTRYLFLGQKYKDNGFVMRYIQVEKEWTLGFIAGENGNEMYNAYEKLSGVELARAYFEPGKKVQVDYNKHDPYVGRDFWDDCNLYGLSSIRINSGPILPETYGEMTGTMFQYSAMKEYANSLMSVCNPVEYLECYMRTPQLEMLNQLSPEGQRVIAGCVLVVAAVGPVFSIISKVSGGVSSLIGIISKIAPVLGPIKTGFAAVNAVMAANPILIIIAAVAALIAIFVTLYNKCEWFRDGVNDIFGAVANFIKGAIDKIKGFFDFDWKLPKIKLPHFKASGEWSLSPLKVPKISVDWYANGGILNSPTIFGANGDSLMGGGEAGKEAVLPIKLLKDYIREENDANNATLAAMIVEAFKSISMTAENNIYIGDKKSITLLTNLVLKQMANKTLATQGAKGK